MNKSLRVGIIGFSVAVIAIAASYRLTEAPPIWYDEGYYIQAAMNIAERGEQVLQVAPGIYESTQYVTSGYPLFYPVALSLWVFGTDVLAARMPMILFIGAFACAAYFFVRRLHGPDAAAWGLLLLGTFPLLYGNGKSVLGEVPGLFFLVLSLLLLDTLERRGFRDWRLAGLCGLCAGLCLAAKPIFVLFLIAAGLSVLWRWRKSIPPVDVIGAGLIGLGVTVGIWYITQFGGEATLGSIVSYYANPYEIDLFDAVVTNAVRLVTDITPLSTLILTVLWGISLWIRRKESTPSVAEVSGFAFCVLVILAFLRLEGWYRYLFPAAAVALPFFPAALAIVWEQVRSVLPRQLRMQWAPFVLVGVMALFQCVQLMSGSFVAQHYKSTRTEDLQTTFQSYGPDASFFIYNVPEIAILLPSRAFYQYIDAHAAVQIGEEQLPQLYSGAVDVVVVDKVLYATRPDEFAAYKLQHSVGGYRILTSR